jgi:HlyD family secretion protein
MNQVWRRRLGWAALAAGGVAAVAYGFWPDPVPVDTAIIQRGDVIVSVEDEGVSQVREVYRVSSPIAGTVQRSPVEVGDKVVRGQSIVASILPMAPSFLDARSVQMGEAAVKAAEAALTLAKANHERAISEARFWGRELSRIENLRVGSTIAERTVDLTRMEAEARAAAEQSAKAEVMLREKELERAKAALLEPAATYSSASERCCLAIPAPENGVVLVIHNESEAVVAAGAPLLEIGDAHDLEIVVELLSRDAVRVAAGARAVIDGWGGSPLNGRVRFIDRAGFKKVSSLGIEEQRVKVWLDLIDPPQQWARLGHDYRVMAKIVVEEATAVLRVPVAALFRQGDSWACFLRRGDRAELALLDLGKRNFEWAEVIRGLNESDTVILYPSDRLTDGVTVTDRKVE